jgi:hypothetical protein
VLVARLEHLPCARLLLAVYLLEAVVFVALAVSVTRFGLLFARVHVVVAGAVDGWRSTPSIGLVAMSSRRWA